jgi:hypothetical protein
MHKTLVFGFMMMVAQVAHADVGAKLAQGIQPRAATQAFSNKAGAQLRKIGEHARFGQLTKSEGSNAKKDLVPMKIDTWQIAGHTVKVGTAKNRYNKPWSMLLHPVTGEPLTGFLYAKISLSKDGHLIGKVAPRDRGLNYGHGKPGTIAVLDPESGRPIGRLKKTWLPFQQEKVLPTFLGEPGW